MNSDKDEVEKLVKHNKRVNRTFLLIRLCPFYLSEFNSLLLSNKDYNRWKSEGGEGGCKK